MTPDERKHLRDVATQQTANATHYEGCHNIHGWCALRLTLDLLEASEERIRKALDALNRINTMRVDEDDFEWLETAEHILNGDV